MGLNINSNAMPPLTQAAGSRSEPSRGFLGVLMLDTRFPRPLGDVGHPETFTALGIEARFHVVIGANPKRVVRQADPALLAPFLLAAEEMVRQGARMITTSCGFLGMYQRELQEAVSVPVVSSSLLWLPRLLAAGERPGVITIDADALGAPHFLGAGADENTPTVGVSSDSELQRQILGNRATLDEAQASDNVVQAARNLLEREPRISCLVLECTNMPPYADALRRATGRRVEHLPSLVQELWKET